MDDNDVIIVIVEYLRLNSKDGEIVITPAELEGQLNYRRALSKST